MYTDYNTTERTSDNLFNNMWKDLAVAGGGAIAGWGTRKAGLKIAQGGGDLMRESRAIRAKPIKSLYEIKDVSRLKQKGLERRVAGKSVHQFGKKITGLSNIYGWMTAAQIGFGIAKSVVTAGESFRISKDELEQQNYTNMYDQDTYYDTRAAFTQRQRALQVIHNSRLSLKPALGGESNYFHY